MKIITKDVLKDDYQKAFLADVLMNVNILKQNYPDFDNWLNKKVLPGLLNGTRTIGVEYMSNKLAGFAILKNDGVEQKLCCLRILPDFQNYHGLGVRLFERSFQELGTNTPLLSVAEERLPSFRKIFDYFGFELMEQKKDYYRKGCIESVFNGTLE